jgi:putative sterol carrier protein
MADLTVADLTTMIREKVGETSGLNATAKIALDDGSAILIDGRSTPATVSNSDEPADVTLRMSLDTMNKLYRKEANATMLVMMGKIKIEGNMMLALQLDKVLS